MALDSCAQICRCLLMVFNGLFAVIGFVLVALGLWLRFGAETKGLFDIDLNTKQFTIGVIVLIVTGVLMLLVAVLGEHGVCAQSKTALSVFTFLVTLLVIAEITAGAMSFLWHDKVSEELAKFYITIYTQYVNSGGHGQAVTLKLLHNIFDCCGIGGPIELFVRDTCPDGNFFKQITFPSCPSTIKDVFQSKAILMLGGFLGIAGFMTVALVLSSVLRRQISQSSSSPPAYVILSSPALHLPTPPHE